MVLVAHLRPSSCAEPNQKFLQVVQTGIDHQHEYNGQSNNSHGPFGRRTLQNHSHVGQRFSKSAPPQRFSSSEAASPNPTSAGAKPNNPNKRCSVWNTPLQECVLRTSTPSPSRTRGPQFDQRWYHSLEKDRIFSSTNCPRQQHPGRNLRTFSRTNPRVSRPARKGRRNCNATRTRSRTTERTAESSTRIMDQPELVDQIKIGHYKKAPSQIERRGKRERAAKRLNETNSCSEEDRTLKGSHLSVLERPSKKFVSCLLTLPKYVERFRIFGDTK